MPTVINNDTYYRTGEVCQILGISRKKSTLWWRLFTEADIKRIEDKSSKIQENQLRSQFQGGLSNANRNQ